MKHHCPRTPETIRVYAFFRYCSLALALKKQKMTVPLPLLAQYWSMRLLLLCCHFPVDDGCYFDSLALLQQMRWSIAYYHHVSTNAGYPQQQVTL